MEQRMPTLHEIQHAFGAALFGDDETIAEHVIDDSIPAAGRVRVYRNTAISVLTDALRLSYLAVDRLVGAEFFDAAAAGFIRSKPPRSAYLIEYGAGFADFLASFAPAQALAYLPDVARFEWALNVAANAPDIPALDPASLAAIDPDAHGSVRFDPHPSLSLLRLDHPADMIADAVVARNDAALAAIDVSAGPVWLVIHRGPDGVEAQRLPEREWQLTHYLCDGATLEAALEAAQIADATALLAGHLTKGRFAGFDVRRPTMEASQ
jgi:hypothetical protein